MGLLRSLAKRALAKVTGADGAPAAPVRPAPTPSASRPDPAPVAATTAPPSPTGAAAPAVIRPTTAPPTTAPSVATSPAPVPTPVAPRPQARRAAAPTAEELAAAEALSRLLAGAQEVKERMEAGEPVVLLDVRDAHETVAGILPGAHLLPLSQLPTRWREVADANEVICYCATGIRSLQAATWLRDKRVFNATSLDGGMAQWLTIGGRVVRPG